MTIQARKQKKINDIGKLLENKNITQDLHDKAVELTKNYSPWIWKKNGSDKITGIVDIFGEMKKEKERKNKRKKKK
jgi:hypothetical protein